MSRIRADRYTNRLGTGAPLFANGVNVTGNVGVGTTVPTSKLSVIGDMNVTGTVSVGGTLTYEDVTNIDSVGIVTARGGLNVGPLTGIAATISSTGDITSSGTLYIASQAQIGRLTKPDVGLIINNDKDNSSNNATIIVKNFNASGRLWTGTSSANATTSEIYGNGNANFQGTVGIGTDSTSNDLVIESSGSSKGLIVRKNSVDSTFLGHNGSGNEGLLILREGGTNKIQLYAESGQTSFINSGILGIGTNNPPSSVILTVRGNNNTTFTNNPANMIIAGNDSATSGSSGAGIFFAGRYLDGQDSTTTFAAISGIKETTSDNEYGGALVFGTRTAGSGGGSFERMRIDSNGYMTKAPSGMVIRSGFYDPGTGTNATTVTTSATFTTLNVDGTGQVGHNIGKFSTDGLTYTKVSSNSHLNISVSIPFYLAVGGTGFGIRAQLSTDDGSNYYTVTGLSNGPADKWGAGGYGGATSGILNYTWNTRMNSSRASAILAKTGTIRFYFEVCVWSSSDTLTIGDYPSYNKKSSIIVQEIAE